LVPPQRYLNAVEFGDNLGHRENQIRTEASELGQYLSLEREKPQRLARLYEWWTAREPQATTALVHGHACGRAKSAQSRSGARSGKGRNIDQRASLSTSCGAGPSVLQLPSFLLGTLPAHLHVLGMSSARASRMTPCERSRPACERRGRKCRIQQEWP
jgi:hypothetical protein